MLHIALLARIPTHQNYGSRTERVLPINQRTSFIVSQYTRTRYPFRWMCIRPVAYARYKTSHVSLTSKLSFDRTLPPGLFALTSSSPIKIGHATQEEFFQPYDIIAVLLLTPDKHKAVWTVCADFRIADSSARCYTGHELRDYGGMRLKPYLVLPQSKAISCSATAESHLDVQQPSIPRVLTALLASNLNTSMSEFSHFPAQHHRSRKGLSLACMYFALAEYDIRMLQRPRLRR